MLSRTHIRTHVRTHADTVYLVSAAVAVCSPSELLDFSVKQRTGMIHLVFISHVIASEERLR